MTDQNIPDVTNEERMLAREWAEFIESSSATWTDRIYAAARVILNDVPAPPHPTLADMTEEERDACEWMQCDVKARDGQWVITDPCDADGDVGAFSDSGEVGWFSPERVTPRPDLPRLEWPGDKKPAPAPSLPDGWRLADHPEHGRVVVTKNIPDSDGYVCFLNPSDTLSMGYDWHLGTPYELTYIDTDQGADQ